ncbi:type III PLP-dependent enzyme [Aliiroseovarius halocynthiae]|uniref:Type III PLP-dependent enzyme n=1 Tax=Aliiroseovarius halocynthiae TaxID=985055 RepID=A0A545SX94_9RHOB|nr:type III PLP-dependent enzyme [Aliiroseovarius halocynthiae]
MSLEPLNQLLSDTQQPICAYYYDLDALAERTKRIVSQLPKQVRFYYAIKANSDLPVLSTLAPHIFGFEVASLGEVTNAREAAADAPIAFGGPSKTNPELEGALLAGVELYHIESAFQLARLSALAATHGRSVNVLLRVNPRFELPDATLQMAGKPTQFGIDQLQIDDILASRDQFEHVNIIGFHFHALSNNLNAASHLKLVETYLQTCGSWQETHRLDIKLINVGGGIGIDYSAADTHFDWGAYCSGLQTLLDNALPQGVEIAMECGRFVTADCGIYLTEVVDIKQNHDQHFAVLRGGTHQFRLPASWQHNHPFHVVKRDQWDYPYPRPHITQDAVTLCGELCTPKDVLARNVMIGELRVGDLVVFDKAGAYGWHISHHDFLSHPHPDRYYMRNGCLFS